MSRRVVGFETGPGAAGNGLSHPDQLAVTSNGPSVLSIAWRWRTLLGTLFTMKQAAVVVLILVVLLTGLPIVVGMTNMPDCPDCWSGALSWGLACAVLVAAVGLVVRRVGSWLTPLHQRQRLFLLAADLDPPPRPT